MEQDLIFKIWEKKEKYSVKELSESNYIAY